MTHRRTRQRLRRRPTGEGRDPNPSAQDSDARADSSECGRASVLLAGGLITDADGRLLLLHRSTPALTQWEVPGGKVEPSETLGQAAKRELSEELGVRVRLLGEFGRCDFVQGGLRHHYVWFKAEVISGTAAVAETGTFDRCEYFTWQQLETLNGEASPSLECLVDLMRQRQATHATIVR